MSNLNVPISPSSRPTQLVCLTVRWTWRQQGERRCTMTSLLWPTSPASTAAPALPTKAWDTSTALIWVCVGKRWEAVILVRFVKKWVWRVLKTCCVCLTGQSAGHLCGQCHREWERSQRLHLSVHRGPLRHQEPERGVLPAFPHWWLTHRYGIAAAAVCCLKSEDIIYKTSNTTL